MLGCSTDSQGSRCHIQPNPGGQPVLMGSPGCSAYTAWLATRKEEQAHSDSDFNTPFRASITHPALLYSLPLETPGRAHHDHRTALQAVLTPLRSSQPAQQMKTGEKQPCSPGVSCPLCFPATSGPGTGDSTVPQRTVCPLCHSHARCWHRQREVLWDLAPLPVPATARPSPAPAP